ncbi:MAG: signal peptidase I [Bacteroidales bacterium]|nr:signal peptidase I [Bacteroidales bacterium]
MTFSITFLFIFCLAYYIGTFAGLWGVFKKAGQKPWLALIPLYHYYIWLKVIERPLWWLIFFAIPYLNVFMFMLAIWKTYRLFDKTRYVELVPMTMFPFVGMIYVGFSQKETFYTRQSVPKKELGFWHSKPLSKTNKSKHTEEGFVKTKTRSWTDALIYAVVAAYIIRTFLFEFYKIPTSSMESTLMVGDFLMVSKTAYGPKIPQTPIAVPFMHNILPFTKGTKSYIESIQFPYYRFPKRTDIKRYDAVVFNYPDGDTVALERSNESYYAILRAIKKAFQNPQKYASQYYFFNGNWHQYTELLQKYGIGYYNGKEYDVINKEYHVIYRPIDKRDNYIKRCVGMPGDKLKIINGVLFINGEKAYLPEKSQLMYDVVTNGLDIGEENRKKLNINEEDHYQIGTNEFIYHLFPEQVATIKNYPNVISITPMISADSIWEEDIFPQDSRYPWNKDNFGEITIPKAGESVTINDSTICLYARIIKNYEGNKLEIKNGKILINDKECQSYTFQMNYYWMMGDNRHNSLDSRYWGFVPENHIVGKASFVWLSLDKFKNWGEGKIRWKRMFRKIK